MPTAAPRRTGSKERCEKGAINIIRQAGFHCIPDARRSLLVKPDLGLSYLFEPPVLENGYALRWIPEA
jgi:hypothetical protein